MDVLQLLLNTSHIWWEEGGWKRKFKRPNKAHQLKDSSYRMVTKGKCLRNGSLLQENFNFFREIINVMNPPQWSAHLHFILSFLRIFEHPFPFRMLQVLLFLTTSKLKITTHILFVGYNELLTKYLNTSFLCLYA